jgi:hypothetical protein
LSILSIIYSLSPSALSCNKNLDKAEKGIPDKWFYDDSKERENNSGNS